MKGNRLVFIISFLLHYIIAEEARLISTKVSYGTKQYMIEMQIGNLAISIVSPINQVIDYCWFSSNSLNAENSMSSNFIRNTEDGKLYDDTFFFNNKKIVLFHFYFRIVDEVNKSPSMPMNSNGYGLPFKFKDKRLSLVHHLKDSDRIDHLSYSFVYQGKYNGDLNLYFGGIPENITKIKKEANCKVDPNQSKWSCKLHKVIIGKHEYINEYEAYFQVASSMTYAPMNFIQFLSKVVLKKEIEKKNCGSYFDQMVYCIDTVIVEMPLIEFQFDNHIISFNATDLFYFDETNFAHLLIDYNPSYGDKWIIGNSFLQYFDALFDYESEEVKLYSHTRINPIHQSSKSLYPTLTFSLRFLVLFTSSVLLIGIIILLAQRILLK